jgi:hypothetical protein
VSNVNFGRLAIAAVVAWLTYLGVSYLVNTFVLADLYAQHAHLFRAQADMNVVLGFGATLVGFFAFAYAFAKGHEGGSGVQEGLRFGVLVAIILVAFAVTWNYVTLPISGRLAAAWVVDTLLEMALYGVVVGLIYKPVARRAP